MRKNGRGILELAGILLFLALAVIVATASRDCGSHQTRIPHRS